MKLTYDEIASMYYYAQKYPEADVFSIEQTSNGIGTITHIQVHDHPETKMNVTDYTAW